EDGEFETLSYVWGKDASHRVIWIDEKSFIVTRNLHKALHVLCHSDDTRNI
ncbi:hypothetical protein K469DRAFT_563342, partial [Zopfia rhizophila CBS 207.26]